MPDWQPYQERENALKEIDSRIAREPSVDRHRFDRALVLTELGRLQEAKSIYIEILKKDPQQFSPFNNLGAILIEQGKWADAVKVFRDVVARFPLKTSGHVNLARALYRTGELQEARHHFEKALELDPHHAGAHQVFAHLLFDLKEEEAAREHHFKGFGDTPWTTSHYRGKNEPTRVLLLISAYGGNAPIHRFLDNSIFQVTMMVIDFYRETLALPAHHLVINAVGDPDLGDASLAKVEKILEQTRAPALNPPARIRPTRREDNARRLGLLEGVVTPRLSSFSREELMGADALAVLEREGIGFPLLVRSPGFHGGHHFMKVRDEKQLPGALAQIPGNDLIVMQFLDARDADEKIRKYRVMMVDGELHPLHKAVSRDWKIHYVTADMVHNAAHREEDAAFLRDMPGVLGARAMSALQRVCDTLGLDYGGADFSLNRQGEILLFEANATMTIPQPEKDARWDYRRPHVQRIHDAVREMAVSRAQTVQSDSRDFPA